MGTSAAYGHTEKFEHRTVFAKRVSFSLHIRVTTTETHCTYDKANNRTAKTETVDGGTPTPWTHQYGTTADGYNSNQVKSVSGGTTTTTFLYDLNGNRSEKQVGGVTTQTYTWDHENRLTQVTDTTLGTYAYSYDHRTRRVLRDESSASGQTDDISFAGGLSVQEYQSGQTSPFVEYIRGSDYGGGIGGVLYTVRGSARSYNAYNSRGDVVSRTDDSETIVWQASYEAFGTRTQEPVTTVERQMANTKDEDAWGGLNEGMRYRDLEFGIFLSRDPAGFVDGPNVYTYVRQNPCTFFDPLGLEVGGGAGVGPLLEKAWYVAGLFGEKINQIHDGLDEAHAWSVGKVTGRTPGEVRQDWEDNSRKLDEIVTPRPKGATDEEYEEMVQQAQGIQESFMQGGMRTGGRGKFPSSRRTKAETDAQVESEAPANPATKNRVKLRRETKRQIEENQPRNSDGEMVDPNTEQPLKPGKIDTGHKPGQEWRKRKRMHDQRESTRREVLDEENNPDLYHLEDRSSNRSRRHEAED